MVAAAKSSAQSPPPASVWQRLREVADLTSYRPRLRDGIVRQELRTTQGDEYVIIQNPETATYLRLSVEDHAILQLMDGTRSVQGLVVEYMLRFRRFALDHLLQLVEDLGDNEFLIDSPSYTYQRVGRLARRRSLKSSADRLLNLYLNREFPIRGFDAALDRLYKGGAWLLLTAPGLILLAATALIGVPLLGWDLHKAHLSLTDTSVLARYALLGYLSLLAIAIIHELGHAFSVKSYGRAIRRSGFCLFYGSPGLYVDTQDMWMAPRRARIAASWAGPYTGFILAGLAGLSLTVFPHGGWVTLVRAFGLTALIENAFQLNPFIQYDGYYILMDWLDIYNLRRRALTFIRFDLGRKLWRREHFNREERVFAVFGTLASVYTVFAIFMVVTFGWDHARSAIQNALRVPNLQSLLLAVLLAMIVIPFAIGVAGRLVGLARSWLRAARRATGAARDRWYRERATLLSQVPALATLGDEPVQALATHLREERFRPGEAIVRQGDAGDRFYLIVNGKADVFVSESTGSQLVSELGPMDYFGERALLEDAPRAATVRAKTKLRLVSLGAKEFGASIGQHIAADAALKARLDELTELDGFAVLQSLGAREKEILLGHLRPLNYAAGETIIRQGDVGADFYLLRAGRVEVSRRDKAGAGAIVQTLGPGDFFGEMAILLDAPRVATVRAVERTSVWGLSRHDFTDLLGGYFNLAQQLAPIVHERLNEDRLVLTGMLDDSRLPAPGSTAPNIELEGADGGRIALSDYKGQGALLWFSPRAADAYETELRAALPLFAAKDVAVLRIVPGPAASPPAPAEEHGSGLETLIDPDQIAYRAFGMYSAGERVDEPPAVPVEQPAEDRDWSGSAWNSALTRSLRYEGGGQTLAALDEGLVVIRPDGSIDALVRKGPDGHLPAPAAVLDLLVAAPRSLEQISRPAEGTAS